MKHKRHRAKNQRSGCLMCKAHKANGNNERAKAKRSWINEVQQTQS